MMVMMLIIFIVDDDDVDYSILLVDAEMLMLIDN